MSMNQSIVQTFNEFKIYLSPQIDIINIQIQKNNSDDIYEANYSLEYLQKYNLFQSCKTIQVAIKLISDFIQGENIQIYENKTNLNFIIGLLSLNVELTLNKKNIIPNKILEKLMNDIKKIKEENKFFKDSYQEINKKIEIIEKDNKKLNQELELIQKENKILNQRIELIEKQNEEFKKDNEIKENEKEKKIIEIFHKDENKIKLINLKNINSIQPHNDDIYSISTFPSGNIISVSKDNSIKIYDIHLNILQNIINAHDDAIGYIEVKDENNFMTCSSDKSIKLWIKKGNKFTINKILNDCHEQLIVKVIYLDNNIISCSWDNTIKIWKEDNNIYNNIIILSFFNKICSILYLNDKNILISSGYDGTKFWNLNKKEINYNNIYLIKHFEETCCGWYNSICRIDEDRIIIQGNNQNSLKVISISNKVIIKDINNPFQCNGITLIEDKGIFLVGGLSRDIRIYQNDNYECVQVIKNAHDDDIFGFVELKDKSIVSYSRDKKIKLWRFENMDK